jgi:non-lysosomal glucosylceramidase
LAASAVAAKFTLAPGERRSVRFAIAWDLPLAVFPRGPAFAKRYTKVRRWSFKRAQTRVESA